ncbi:hypothetical protein ABFB50_00055 [Dehalococcoides sp. THU3]|uniref:hypothetical protein n=1 Tax=Dehalococcoides TaxID=61434 RepID=UPI0005B57D17|nr:MULTISPECIES: hypothetical protein [Dehalococcoides]QYY57823.1 hypothetical protein CWV2_001086 [Dehalococcoides mccartyi]BAQ34928.1 putative membrane protein [Dehalococcoides sp. UCH007]
MKRPEGILVLAIWQFCAAFFSLADVVIITLFFMPAIAGLYDYAREGAAWGLSILSFFTVTYLLISLIGGIGLLKGRKYGRVFSLYQAAFSLLIFPLGTAAGIAGLIYLNQPNIKQYLNTR